MKGRIFVALGAIVMFAGLFALPASGAVDPENVEGGTVDKVGWWTQANARVDNPTGPITVPPPPGIPEDRLVVGAAAGEPASASAIGFLPDAQRGDTLTSFTLTIEESDDPANQGGDIAVIGACPILSFWAGGENGTWDTRPEWDCKQALAEGTREDGVWTFDLAPIAQLWLDPFGTVAADGFVLVEGAEPPGSFQVVFDPSTIELVLTFDPAEETPDDGFVVPDAPTDISGSTGNFSAPISSGSNASTFSPTPSFDSSSPDVTTPAVDESDTGDEAALDAAPIPVRASRAGEVFGNFPGGLPFLVIAVGGLLVMMGLALGPLGEPMAHTRQRGVSRALEARAAAAREARETP